MLQVKIFRALFVNNLEYKINTFLNTYRDTIEVIDIKYQVSWGESFAMIVYKEKISKEGNSN